MLVYPDKCFFSDCMAVNRLHQIKAYETLFIQKKSSTSKSTKVLKLESLNLQMSQKNYISKKTIHFQTEIGYII